MPIACVELKVVVSRRSLDAYVLDVSNDVRMMHLSSPHLTSYMPKEDVAQVAHQMAVTRNNFGVYVCASEVGIVFTLMIYCPTSTLDVMPETLNVLGRKFAP